MKLKFVGHDFKYAVEQMMLSLFPEERPEYADPLPENENTALVTFTETNGKAQSFCRITFDGKTAEGSAVLDCAYSDENDNIKACQRTVRFAFFDAAEKIIGKLPPWGALTGIRPARLLSADIESGMSEAEAAQKMREEFFVSDERINLCLDAARASAKAKALLLPTDVSLYIGIPFCPTRCAYCSFVSASVERMFALIAPYVDALCAELKAGGDMLRELGLNVRTIYIGGGTPTTLEADQLDRLIGAIESSFDLSRLIEFTVEAGRPDTVTAEKLRVLKAHNVDRISINPQTMEDRVLNAIGRRHSADDIRRAMDIAKDIGIEHVNMDLIAGLPEDSYDGFCRTLESVFSLGADNITVHTLALKKGSRILLDGLAIPGAEEVAKMLEKASEEFPKYGFSPYYLYRQKYMSGSFENVGWCKTDCECLYNIYIMEELHSILSIGAGGSTKMVPTDSKHRIERVFNFKYPTEYISRPEKANANLKAFSDFYKNLG